MPTSKGSDADEGQVFGVADETGLVPPRRLGALLSERRRASGVDVAQMAARSEGRFSPADLTAFERGQLVLDDETVARLSALYAIESGPVVPQRTQLIIDLTGPEMRVGETVAPLPTEPTADELLGRYLSLLYLLRNMEPGSSVPLRVHDLEVLSQALRVTVDDIRGHLAGLMVEPEVAARSRRFRARLAVPAVGLLVGVTAVGAVVLVRSDEDSSPSVAAAALLPAVGEPIAPTGAPAEAPIVVQPAETAPEPDPAVDLAGPTPVETEPLVVTDGAPVDLDEPASVDPEVVPEAVVIAEPEVVVPEAEPAPEVVIDEAVVVTPETVEPPAAEPTPAGVASEATGAAAEVLVGYPFRDLLPGWTFEYLGPRPGYRGNTNLPTSTITIYIAEGDSAQLVAEVLAHEVGHALDVTYLDDAARQQWLEARGATAVPWWPGDGLNDFDTGAGDLAEAVAFWLTGSATRSTIAGPPTTDQIALLQNLLP